MRVQALRLGVVRRSMLAVAAIAVGILVFGGVANATPTVTSTYGFTGGLQQFVVPSGVTSVTIHAAGAQGGASSSSFSLGPGGPGAAINGDFAVSPGETLEVLVGGVGRTGTNGGGGGGSFVWTTTAPVSPLNLLVAAGGGGGGACFSANGFVAPGVPGQAGPSGTPSVLGFPGGGPFSGGAGGNPGFNGGGGGGAGLLFSAGNGGGGFGSGGGGGGQAITFGGNGGSTGAGFPSGSMNGGFGGGGGGSGAAGGGGGYGGGGGGTAFSSCDAGGGGGSFNAGANQLNITGGSFGNGLVSFTYTISDSDLALANVPADITVDATSTSGAVVDYTPPTVVDEDSPLPTVTCDMPSGSAFPIGTTTVTCSVTDPDDTPSHVSASFHVTVNDTDLALTGTPADITVNATSAVGAVVGYTAPTAVDEDSPLPTVTCSAAPGSTFAIGSTTVTCTVSDPDDTPSSVSSTFTVTVLGASAQLGQLATAVAGVGPGTSLASKVQSAIADLAAGDVKDAKGVLNAFINEVKAQAGKKITQAQAAQLTAAAQQILAVIG